jgi:type VI secretion system protein ImpE
MLAEQLVQEGNVAAALKALQDTVRQQPASARQRVFLFQLLCVAGDWPRALTQLNVAAELDAATLPMVQTYREAIQCEALRAELFAGRRDPVIFGAPQPWMAQLAEALKLDASDPAAAALLRAQAFDAAPATPGSIDGRRFAWLADADGRLGPILEAIVNGRYVWVPFMRIARIEIDPPGDLRDAVWTAATFTWTNGAQTVGLIPTRYPGSAVAADDALKLARRTEWDGDRPLGQRMLTTDADDHALMDVRIVEFDTDIDIDTDPDTVDDHG